MSFKCRLVWRICSDRLLGRAGLSLRFVHFKHVLDEGGVIIGLASCDWRGLIRKVRNSSSAFQLCDN